MFNQCPKQKFFMKALFSQFLSSSQLEIQVQVSVLSLDYFISKQNLHLELGLQVRIFLFICFNYLLISSSFCIHFLSRRKILWCLWLKFLWLWNGCELSDLQVKSSSEYFHDPSKQSISQSIVQIATTWWSLCLCICQPSKLRLFTCPMPFAVCSAMWISTSSETVNLRF